MPWYCYTAVDGETQTQQFPMASIPDSITLPDGRVAVRDRRAEQCGFINTPGNWPMTSDALGRHPNQAKEYYEYTKKHGCPTLLNDRGQAEINSHAQRNKLLKLFRARDHDAGYGDQA